jgi:hypothetical protein
MKLKSPSGVEGVEGLEKVGLEIEARETWPIQKAFAKERGGWAASVAEFAYVITG